MKRLGGTLAAVEYSGLGNNWESLTKGVRHWLLTESSYNRFAAEGKVTLAELRRREVVMFWNQFLGATLIERREIERGRLYDAVLFLRKRGCFKNHLVCHSINF